MESIPYNLPPLPTVMEQVNITTVSSKCHLYLSSKKGLLILHSMGADKYAILGSYSILGIDFSPFPSKSFASDSALSAIFLGW